MAALEGPSNPSRPDLVNKGGDAAASNPPGFAAHRVACLHLCKPTRFVAPSKHRTDLDRGGEAGVCAVSGRHSQGAAPEVRLGPGSIVEDCSLLTRGDR